MSGQETPQRITLPEQEQRARRHVGIAAHQPERASDLPVRQRGQHTVCAGAAAARKPAQPLELQGIKILPARATDLDGRPVHCAAVHLVREHLVGVIRNTGRTTVPSDSPAHVGALSCSYDTRAIRNFYDQHILPGQLNKAHPDRGGRLRHVRDQRLNPKRIGPPRLMPR